MLCKEVYVSKVKYKQVSKCKTVMPIDATRSPDQMTMMINSVILKNKEFSYPSHIVETGKITLARSYGVFNLHESGTL